MSRNYIIGKAILYWFSIAKPGFSIIYFYIEVSSSSNVSFHYNLISNDYFSVTKNVKIYGTFNIVKGNWTTSLAKWITLPKIYILF